MLTPKAAPPVMVVIWPMRRRELVMVTERARAGMTTSRCSPLLMMMASRWGRRSGARTPMGRSPGGLGAALLRGVVAGLGEPGERRGDLAELLVAQRAVEQGADGGGVVLERLL